jgi:hypothetical protein
MRQTHDDITQSSAERWCWEVARRDDLRVARRLYRQQEVDGAYRLDEGAVLDEFFHFLLAVVGHLGVVNHIIPRLLVGSIVTERRTLTFETAKEPLGHGIVQAIALATHTTAICVCAMNLAPSLQTRPVHPCLRYTGAPRKRPGARPETTAINDPSAWLSEGTQGIQLLLWWAWSAHEGFSVKR